MPFDGLHYQGKNFAPVKPLQDAKRTTANPKDNPSSINALFREKWQGFSSENEAAWRETIMQGQTIANCREGKLVMKRDLVGTGYVFVKPLSSNRGRDRSNFPLFPSNSETLKSKWQRARPQCRARHFGDGYKAEIQLTSVDTMIASYFKDIFTPLYELRESLSAQDYGTYITQFQYDDKLNQIMQVVPIIQNQSKVLVDGYGACMECGKEGHPDDFAKTKAPYPQCPDCGSFKTTAMMPDVVADEAVITDVDTITQGDICGYLRDFPACRFDTSVLPHESAYFLYSEHMPLSMIRSMFGEDIEIDESEADDIGFQVMDALAARGGNIENLGENNVNTTFDRYMQTGVLRNMWLKPECYAGEKLEKAEDTLAGRIPADVPLEQIWPEGVCVRGFNDMALQVGIHAEKANISSGVYMLMSHTGIGKGVDDAVDIAKDLNELHSMGMAGIKRYAASGLAIDKNAGLTQENVRDLFKPNKAVFVDTTHNQGDINRTISQLHTQPVNPAIPQYAIQLSNLLNMAFMTGDFTQGLVQDVDINTFGGF
jgi:predicted Zn-ribbon and HTH transcriptional regulator